MADIPGGDDDELFDDFGASLAVGQKVIEMAERLKLGEKFVKGAVAKWAFEMDGQRFEVELRLDQGGD